MAFFFLTNTINDIQNMLSSGAVGHVKRNISMFDSSSKLRLILAIRGIMREMKKLVNQS